MRGVFFKNNNINIVRRIAFYISTILSLYLIYFGSIIPFLNWSILLFGILEYLYILYRGYLYSSTLFGFHLIMTFFFEWVYLNRDYVDKYDIFDFSVFTDNNLQIAIISLICVTLLINLTIIFFTRNRKTLYIFELLKTKFETTKNSTSSSLFFIIAFSFLMSSFFLTDTTILDVPYSHLAEFQFIPYELIKVPIFLACLANFFASQNMFINQVNNRVLAFNITNINFLFNCIVMLLIIGSRGYVTFLLILFGIINLYFSRRSKIFFLWGIIFIFLSILCYEIWPFLRVFLSQMSLFNAFSMALDSSHFLAKLQPQVESFDSQIITLSNFQMIGQSIFHFLYVINLTQQDIFLNGSTFYNLIPQSVPAYFDGVFGFTRPLNDNYVLAEYYRHGGGFLMVANAYWNGGLTLLLVYIFILTVSFIWFDHAIQKITGKLYFFMYVTLFPIMVVQLCYGIQGMMRVVEVLAAFIILNRVIKHKKHNLSHPNIAG